uniref:Uncharacterized protein n=1 Tax=Heterorhabditis bacteriophora TaxID=37862 RepID=A0A1I7X749_HETBA
MLRSLAVESIVLISHIKKYLYCFSATYIFSGRNDVFADTFPYAKW